MWFSDVTSHEAVKSLMVGLCGSKCRTAIESHHRHDFCRNHASVVSSPVIRLRLHAGHASDWKVITLEMLYSKTTALFILLSVSVWVTIRVQETSRSDTTVKKSMVSIRLSYHQLSWLHLALWDSQYQTGVKLLSQNSVGKTSNICSLMRLYSVNPYSGTAVGL